MFIRAIYSFILTKQFLFCFSLIKKKAILDKNQDKLWFFLLFTKFPRMFKFYSRRFHLDGRRRHYYIIQNGGIWFFDVPTLVTMHDSFTIIINRKILNKILYFIKNVCVLFFKLILFTFICIFTNLLNFIYVCLLSRSLLYAIVPLNQPTMIRTSILVKLQFSHQKKFSKRIYIW